VHGPERGRPESRPVGFEEAAGQGEEEADVDEVQEEVEDVISGGVGTEEDVVGEEGEGGEGTVGAVAGGGPPIVAREDERMFSSVAACTRESPATMWPSRARSSPKELM
jgi:hypothetical protein